MAYEKINDFTDHLKAEYVKADKSNDTYKAFFILDTMMAYYRTALSQGKFVAQRYYFRRVLSEINPAFADGIFIGNKLRVTRNHLKNIK